MKRHKTNLIIVAIMAMGLWIMCVTTGCNQEKKAKWIDLQMTVFINSVPTAKGGNFLVTLRRSMDPYILPSEERNDKPNRPAIEIHPQKADLVRLDCQGENSAFAILDWKGWLLRISEKFGQPRIKRYKNDWEKNGLRKITMETISGLCSKAKVLKSPDYARIQPIGRFKYFYVLSRYPAELMNSVGQSFNAESLNIVKTPEALWTDIYERLSKVPAGSTVSLGILYDVAGRPVFSYRKVMDIFLRGNYQKAMNKLHEALRVTQDDKLKKLNEKVSKKLKVDIVLRYLKAGKAVIAPLIDPKLTLSSDTPYSVSIEPSNKCYLYIFQVDSANKVDLVFPNREYSTKENPVASSSLRIPEEHERWFKLDKTTGTETFYILAVPFQNQYLEDLFKKKDKNSILAYLARLRKSKPIAPGIVFDEYSFTHS